MTFTHKPGSGTAFVNNYKEKDTQPDFKGTLALLDGTILEIAMWEGLTNGGEKKFSLKVQPQRERQGKQVAQNVPQSTIDDEIPF